MSVIRIVAWLALATTLLVARSTSAAEPTKQECVAADDAGQSLRHTGKLHDARESFLLCAAKSCPALVRDDCGERLRETSAAMPSLVFEIKDDDGIDVPMSAITVDGQPLATSGGGALPVDPGEHHVVVEVGTSRTEATVVVHEGDREHRVQLVLGNHHGVVTPPAIPAATAAPRTTPAIVAFGAAGGALVLGTVFTIEGANAKSQASSACGPSGNQCPGDASSRNATIRTDTAVAFTGFGLAAAGAVVGVLLLPHAPPAHSQGSRQLFPVLGLGYAGLGGSF